MGNTVIAIDGPAASGKSTLARKLATTLSFLHVDSGALYRAVTWAFLEYEVDTTSPETFTEALPKIELLASIENGHFQVFIKGRGLNQELRTEAVNSSVSKVASNPEVRTLVTQKLHDLADSYSCVVEGRDIGSVVFPDTPYKIFLDAPLHIRAGRRESQGHADCIASRDEADTKRVTAPLKATADALHVDVGHKTAKEVLEVALELLSQKGLSLIPQPLTH